MTVENKASIRYYISTGDKNGFYTLRSVYQGTKYGSGPDGEVEGYTVYVDAYQGNLATEWNRALAKAKKRVSEEHFTALLSEEPFELTPFGRNSAAWLYALEVTNPYAIPFGKYFNQDFRTTDDTPYLEWLLTALYSKRCDTSREYHFIPVRVALALYLDTSPQEINARKEREQEERKAAWEAQKKPAPRGRVTLEGEVIKRKLYEGDFGRQWKMVVKCDGFAVYGSIPSSLAGVKVGERVHFDATVEPSPDDKSFGFFKRPTKGHTLEQET